MSHINCVARGFGLWLVVASLGLGGCYAHARAEPVLVEAEYTPVHLDIYPHTVYEGRVVYLVDGHWYTRDRGRWVYYRVEPRPLYRQRVVVQQAPRAQDRRPPRRVVHERRYERERDRRHDRHDADRVRERREVHEAPPAMHRD